jgi:2,4-dienoyl-CoA reductase (NADPH2)
MALFYAEDYAFNERLCAFYRERARGGVGLMIMGPMAIDRVGSNPLMAGLFEDSQVEAIREFVREVHEETEARVGVQLMHLGRYASSMVTGMQPIAPTALASPLNNEVPREMDADDIETVQDAFVKAALRARDAGCDFVELMAAGGYLIGEFLSPATNRRIDKYGGSSRNRMRFGLEIIEKVRQALGDGLALGIRVSGRDFITMGRTSAESVKFCVEAERRGVNCINVTGGWHETNIP